jgi:SAM-dependent methyltransferase
MDNGHRACFFGVTVRRSRSKGVNVDHQVVLEAPEARSIEEVFLPFVSRKLSFSDAEWRRLFRKARIFHGLRYLRRRFLPFLQSSDAFNAEVKQTYDSIWAQQDFARDFVPDRNVSALEWRGVGYYANPAVTQRFHLACMADVIRQLHVQKALEVGSGRGMNLFVLAGLLPEISWTGLELTDSGVNATMALINGPAPPAGIAHFSPRPLVDLEAYRRITVQQGSAAALPFGEAEFDLVFTRQALEQMEPLRHEALAEIARVAKSYVLLIEPFRDVNATGLRRQYIVASNYFQGRVEELRHYGLEPTLIFEDWPNKITLKTALVVAKVGKR